MTYDWSDSLTVYLIIKCMEVSCSEITIPMLEVVFN
jgi:hypothetical protein